MKLPFRVSLRGTVEKMTCVSTSQSGNAMQEFLLQDTQMQCVRCMAFDRHVGCDALQEGNDVVLYFACAQSGLQNKAGFLWLFNESHIMLVRPSMPVRSSAKEVELW